MSESGIQRVAIAGAGKMGQQIALAALAHRFDVRLYDTNPKALDIAARTKEVIGQVLGYSEEKRADLRRLVGQLKVQTDLAQVIQDADLVIECVPERARLKKDFLRQVSPKLSPETLIVTNSSMILPSELMGEVTGPERFASLHFLSETPGVEIMGHPGTSQRTIERLRAFVEEIGHRPFVCHREHPGQMLNHMLVALNYAALSLAANGIGEPAEIDAIWMLSSRTDSGPFGQLDIIGLDTALDITKLQAVVTGDPQVHRNIAFLQTYVDAGRLGVKAGRGIYDYPNPAYKDPEFLKIPAGRPAVVPDEIPASIDAVSQASRSESRSNRERPLVNSWSREAGGGYQVEFLVDPTRLDCLKDHVFRGTPLLPAAAILELFVESLTCVDAETRPSEWMLSNVEFLNGIRCFTDQPQRVFVHLIPDQEAYLLELRQVFCNRQGAVIDPARLCSRGRANRALHQTVSEVPKVAATQTGVIRYADTGGNTFGPTMRRLFRLGVAEMAGWGELAAVGAAAGEMPGEDFCLPVAMLDGALVACAVNTRRLLPDVLQLPKQLREMRLLKELAPSSGGMVTFQAISVSATGTEYDLDVWNTEGEICLCLRGYECHALADPETRVFDVEWETRETELNADLFPWQSSLDSAQETPFSICLEESTAIILGDGPEGRAIAARLIPRGVSPHVIAGVSGEDGELLGYLQDEEPTLVLVMPTAGPCEVENWLVTARRHVETVVSAARPDHDPGMLVFVIPEEWFTKPAGAAIANEAGEWRGLTRPVGWETKVVRIPRDTWPVRTAEIVVEAVTANCRATSVQHR
ncbi:MAG: polyketide synthase dehydratase domain-containing protein [Planctomycetaceae bacterium]|nr:polyketide synthase dehydratase domain-containing protein [Planctomycetaceae bacterium]